MPAEKLKKPNPDHSSLENKLLTVKNRWRIATLGYFAGLTLIMTAGENDAQLSAGIVLCTASSLALGLY